MQSRNTHTSILLSGAACLALATAMPAQAQEAEEDGARRLGAVTVTATRREASIQDVPIAVSAYDPEVLDRQGVVDLTQLEQISPSFNLNASQTTSQGTTLRIRGVGTTGNNIGFESSVGVFIDGVYYSRPGIALGDLVDLQQVEILRGPQGTLFGRNTSAGALNITTRKPDLEKVDGFANLTYGNFNALNVQAGGNIPIIKDQLAVRLSGAYQNRDATITSTAINPETGDNAESHNRDRFLIRGQALWEPASNVSIRLIGDYSEINESCCDSITLSDSVFFQGPLPVIAGIVPPVGAPAVGFGISATGLPGDDDGAFEQRISNQEQFENPAENWGISGELNWDFDFAKLTYVGAYRDFFASSVQETDGGSLNAFTVGGPSAPLAAQEPTTDEIQSQTHELRIQGLAFDNRLDWLIGGFYSEEDIFERQILSLGPQFQQSNSVSILGLGAAVAPLFGLTPEQVFGILGSNPANALALGVDAAGDFAINEFSQSSTSWSIFTHNTFAVTDQFDFTVGLRYVNEDKDGSFEQPFSTGSAACFNTLAAAGNPGLLSTDPLVQAVFGAVAPLGVGLGCLPFVVTADAPGSTNAPIPGLGVVLPTPATFDENFEDEELVYTIKAAYELSSNLNAYASFTHGFKAGGFNLDSTAASSGANPAFEAEEIDAFEVGLKGSFFDGRVRADLAIFNQTIDDFQVLEFTGTQFTTFNVPSAISRGVELEALAQATDQLSLTMGLTYTDAGYPNDCADELTSPNVTSLCGAELTNAPSFVGVWGGTWEDEFQGFGQSLTYFGNVNVRYESDRRTSTQPTEIIGGAETDILLPFDIQEANTKINLRAGIGHVDGLWQIEAWATNVTDKQTRNATFNTPLRGFPLAPGTQARGAFLQDPRFYGVTLRTKF